MRKCLPLLSLVVAPAALAEGTAVTDAATQATVSTARRSGPAPDPQWEKQIEDLQHEVAELKAEVNASRARSNVREYASDLDSHPGWP